MTLREMSEMGKQHKKSTVNYTELTKSYKTGHDISLLDTIASDLDLIDYIKAHKKIYCLDAHCVHPNYRLDIIYALNVFEGCQHYDLTLKEKKLAIIAALFRNIKKSTVTSNVYRQLQQDGRSIDVKDIDILDTVFHLNKRKTKPSKNDTVISMILWDARYMYLYNPDLNRLDYLLEVFQGKEVNELAASYMARKIINIEFTTNWGRLKAFKLNWSDVVINIYKDWKMAVI
jgi:hypothetical protein